MPKDIIISERGNTLATSEDGGIMFRGQLPDGTWVVFDYFPGNYPAVSAGIVTGKNADQMRDGVQEHYKGWTLVKNNIGVAHEDGAIT